MCYTVKHGMMLVSIADFVMHVRLHREAISHKNKATNTASAARTSVSDSSAL